MNIVLDISPGHLDLDTTLRCGQVFRWTRLGDWWFGMLGDVMVKMRQEKQFLNVKTSAAISESKLEDYLRLDDDLGAIIGGLSKDRIFRSVANQVSGLRLLRQDPWECLVSYICSRNCKIAMISRILNNLSQKFGKKVVWKRSVNYCFPEPNALCQAELSEIASCGLRYGKRQAYELKQIAKLVCEGAIDFEILRRMTYSETKKILLSFDHGVGNKVADCVLLFSLEKLEAFPVDVWVGRAVVQLYGKFLGSEFIQRIDRTRHLSARDYGILSEFGQMHFGRYAGYAQEYLYHWTRLQHNACDQ
ncbi:MAG: hypothetical protein NTX81_00495 [Candidatus Bathyarchaeota archaeon]|nr:hypothetical protein [Candidatus Bathyarchaeota archaeon]